MNTLRSWLSVLDPVGRVLTLSPEDWPAPTKRELISGCRRGRGGEGERGRGGEGERGRGERGERVYDVRRLEQSGVVTPVGHIQVPLTHVFPLHLLGHCGY